MAITIERQGQRVYLTGDTYSVKDRIKSMGGHWDGDRRAWWVGVAKEAEAKSLVESLSGAAATAGVPAARAKEGPDNIRLIGKGEYKGRTYYLGARTRDGQRIRCLTLPDKDGNYLDFWADLAAVRIVKEYRPRERSWRGRTHTEYTTLGSIARFIAQQRRAEERGEPACPVCGKRGELVHDLEDGGMKCYRCCDMPAD